MTDVQEKRQTLVNSLLTVYDSVISAMGKYHEFEVCYSMLLIWFWW